MRLKKRASFFVGDCAIIISVMRILFLITLLLLAAPVSAQEDLKPKMLGGVLMPVEKTIAQNLPVAPEFSLFVMLLKTARMMDALKDGPFTVFVPDNEALGNWPAAKRDFYLQEKNSLKLYELLSYHFVPGVFSPDDLAKAVDAGGGRARIKTLQGGYLIVKKIGTDGLEVVDGKGFVARIRKNAAAQADGYIYAIDRLLTP